MYSRNYSKTHRLPVFVRILIFLLYLAAGCAAMLFLANRMLGVDIPFLPESCSAVSDSSVSGTDTVSGGDAQESLPDVAEIYAERTYPNGGEHLALTAVDADGSTVWEYIVDCPERIWANGSTYDTLEWMINGDTVYVNNAHEEILTALDRRNGQIIWELNGAFGCPIVYDFGSDGTLCRL